MNKRKRKAKEVAMDRMFTQSKLRKYVDEESTVQSIDARSLQTMMACSENGNTSDDTVILSREEESERENAAEVPSKPFLFRSGNNMANFLPMLGLDKDDLNDSTYRTTNLIPLKSLSIHRSDVMENLTRKSDLENKEFVSENMVDFRPPATSSCNDGEDTEIIVPESDCEQSDNGMKLMKRIVSPKMLLCCDLDDNENTVPESDVEEDSFHGQVNMTTPIISLDYAVETQSDDESVEDSLASLTSGDDTDKEFLEIDVTGTDGQVVVYGRDTKKSRKDLCVYCKKYVMTTSFVRHLTRKHKNETKVIEIESEQKGTLSRRRKIQLLRNSGNHIHNRNVFEKGGSLIVVQKPRRTVNLSKSEDVFVCCRSCVGLYSKRDVWRHSCPSENLNEKKLTIKSTAFMLDQDASILRKCFHKMRKAENLTIIKNDDLMCQYIREQLTRKGFKRYQTVRNEVNLMTNLLKKIRCLKSDFSISLRVALSPVMFDYLYNAILILFQYEVNDDGEFVSINKPSSLTKLCQGLMKICETLHVFYLKRGAQEAVKKTLDEATLLEKELRPLMNNATQVLRSATSGLPEDLPNPGQVIALKDHLHKILHSLELNTKIERLLKEAALTYLILFNKRRSSEVANLKINCWNLRAKWKQQALEEMNKLDSTEKILIQTLEVVYVKVPIINWLSSLGEHFIFESGSQTAIRGNDAVRHMAKDAGIRTRELTSTKLRKLAATTLQLQNFNEVEYRVLCDHLGHTIPVHNRWYRMRTSTVELTKVAKMLMEDFKQAGETNAGCSTTEVIHSCSDSNQIVASDTNDINDDDISTNDQPADRKIQSRSPRSSKRKSKKVRPWTEKQTNYLLMRCARNIASNTTLRKAEAVGIKDKMRTLFANRTWKDIKNKVRNEALSRRNR